MKIRPSKGSPKQHTFLLGTAFSLGLAALPAAAGINADPGDYTGLPGGTDIALLYYQHLAADDVYVKGKKVVDNLDLKLDVGVLRMIHFVEIGGWVIDPQFILPFGKQRVGLTDQEVSGIGDLQFGATFWPLHDLKNNHHFGVTTFFTAPTGAHKGDGFALSNNRWAFDVQAGYIRNIAPKWTLELLGQVEFYQDQRDTHAKKDPLYQADAILRYNFSDATYVAATYRHAWGAKETLNGATLADRANNGTAVLTWASFLSKQWQLQLQYRQDLHIENGPKVGGPQARLLYLF